MCNPQGILKNKRPLFCEALICGRKDNSSGAGGGRWAGAGGGVRGAEGSGSVDERRVKWAAGSGETGRTKAESGLTRNLLLSTTAFVLFNLPSYLCRAFIPVDGCPALHHSALGDPTF